MSLKVFAIVAIAAIVAFAAISAIFAHYSRGPRVLWYLVAILSGSCIAGVCMLIMLLGTQNLRALLRGMS